MKSIQTEIITSPQQISDLLDLLTTLHSSPDLSEPTMYIDLEGTNLSREGTVSILTLLIETSTPTRRVSLIDIHSLGPQAFNTPNLDGKTLKDILQDVNIPKIFFDVRNDSDALFAHFGVALRGVQDLQLMESASRETTKSRRYLNGLAKCVEKIVLYGPDLASWKLAKEEGGKLFKPDHGGSCRVFEQRPISDEIVAYCVGDVQVLPDLWRSFPLRGYLWRDLVQEETRKRVEASHAKEYKPHGRDRALASWSVEQNKMLDQWNYVPPRRRYLDEDDGWDDEGSTGSDVIDDYDYEFCHSD